MRRVEEARARKAKRRVTEDAVEGALNPLVDRHPFAAEVFESAIKYGVEGAMALKRVRNPVGVAQLVAEVCGRLGLR